MTDRKYGYSHLSNRAEGAFLKEEFLEAFLIQACLIEGIVKEYFLLKIEQSISKDKPPIKKFEDYDFSKSIDFLFLCGKINELLFNDLHKYRKERNRVFHKLLIYKYKVKEGPDKELEQAYKLGKNIKDYIVKDFVKEVKRNNVQKSNNK